MKQSLDEFYTSLDKLYLDKRTEEIEGFLKRTMEEHRVCCGDHDAIYVAALNELGTYYRGVNKLREALQAFTACGDELLAYGTKDSANYATNLINQASVHRLEKNYVKALALYEEAKDIFQRTSGLRSYGYASTLNNMSLVYLDLEDYNSALDCAEQALSIVSLFPAYKEEEAISLVNKAAALRGLNSPEAYVTAKAALELYEAVPQKGIHYQDARNLLRVLESPITPKASVTPLMAKAAPLKGLELSHAYYETVARPLLENEFRAVFPRLAIGLAGDGSECYGYDDLISRDHDWGPGFCIWLTDEDYSVYGAALEYFYGKLPQTFKGYSRLNILEGAQRVGVQKISSFYNYFIGSATAPTTLKQWSYLPEENLAKATNGEVFQDTLGAFSTIRQQLLAYYPLDVRLKKLSVRAATMAQSGQYNYPRSLKRGDKVAANFALQEFIRATISWAHLFTKKYMPYYKWAFRSLQDLDRMGSLSCKLEQLASGKDESSNITVIESICSEVRALAQEEELVQAEDSFLITSAEEIRAKIQDAALRSLPLLQEY